MKHIIDIDTWERRDNYNFFRTFHNSWISITSEVECGEALAAAKASGRSFFLYYLYAILRAAKHFYTVRIPYHEDFECFYAEARRIITSIPEDGDPYGTDKEIEEKGDYDVVQLSATPQLYFTSLTYTQKEPGHPLDYPLMNAGKAVIRGGVPVMPIALTVSHAFVDGAHIAQFFQKVEKTMKELAEAK